MLYSGVSKFMNLLDFAFGMTNSNLFDGNTVFFLSYFIPLFEIILGVVLLFKKMRIGALYALISLMILYSIYLAVFKYYAVSGWCSCGSVIDLSLTKHLIFNAIITIPLVITVFLMGKEK
ncbi:hypothetical protein AWN68_12100 [Roseivirga echinicomitans]|uniref:Methylamine utilisation protein MauE domain-containing protein n=2 Tax=Roseivirga echinicomitans TaxID=296218 RepID=A0A150X177_9BACT|nr:hypothetical protein AWN68_12100 [Roseivirga echinicomitans]